MITVMVVFLIVWLADVRPLDLLWIFTIVVVLTWCLRHVDLRRDK
jgi:hypothetical protein